MNGTATVFFWIGGGGGGLHSPVVGCVNVWEQIYLNIKF